MAVLSGGGNWKTLQKEPIGTVTIGLFVSFTPDVPSDNPAYPPQSRLVLEIDGDEKTIGCPTALDRPLKANLRALKPGETVLRITFLGQAKGKRGVAFHNFKVEDITAEGGGGASFDHGANVAGVNPASIPAANEPMAAADPADVAKRLADARARRAA